MVDRRLELFRGIVGGLILTPVGACELLLESRRLGNSMASPASIFGKDGACELPFVG
jgi:hypothetical protein